MIEEWTEGMKVYQHGTFVIFPPSTIRSFVNQLREEYDPVSQSICDAHITLTQPFLNRPSQSDWDRILMIVNGFQPFLIRYGPLNTFLPYPCIYYEIHSEGGVLQRLNQLLHATGFFNLSLPYSNDFIPHMSINDGYPDTERTREIFLFLKDKVSGGLFICTHIAFIVPDNDFHFETVCLLPLGPSPD